jgi:predicted XRE-type DNA-binding protein
VPPSGGRYVDTPWWAVPTLQLQLQLYNYEAKSRLKPGLQLGGPDSNRRKKAESVQKSDCEYVLFMLFWWKYVHVYTPDPRNTRMLAAAVIDEIRELLSAGELSQRRIAHRLAVSRGTVNAVAQGKRPDRRTARAKINGFVPPSGPPSWCAGCGHLVQMPCLACFLRGTSLNLPGCLPTASTARRPGRSSD